MSYAGEQGNYNGWSIEAIQEQRRCYDKRKTDKQWLL